MKLEKLRTLPKISQIGHEATIGNQTPSVWLQNSHLFYYIQQINKNYYFPCFKRIVHFSVSTLREFRASARFNSSVVSSEHKLLPYSLSTLRIALFSHSDTIWKRTRAQGEGPENPTPPSLEQPPPMHRTLSTQSSTLSGPSWLSYCSECYIVSSALQHPMKPPILLCTDSNSVPPSPVRHKWPPLVLSQAHPGPLGASGFRDPHSQEATELWELKAYTKFFLFYIQ